MSGTIKKVQSLVNFPKNRYDNQIYFHVGQEDSHIDMKASYVELELDLPGLPDNYHNVVLGQDGMFYNSSALFRDAKISEGRTGASIADLLYVNILSNNLEYYSKGANNVVADALFDGKGHAGYDNNIVSVFNNDYEDTPNAVVRCPLNLLYPGSIGQADLFPQSDDLIFRYLLEPQFKVFMRAVKAGAYVPSNTLLPVDASGNLQNKYACGTVTHNTATVTASAVGVVGNFAVADRVLILGTMNGAPVAFSRNVTAITADASGTPGNLTIDAILDATNDLTSVVIVKLLPNVGTVKANDLRATGKVLTLNGTKPAEHVDLWTDTTVSVSYTSIDGSGNQTLHAVKNQISSQGISGGVINTITLVDDVVVPAGSVLVNVAVQPLYTNITADWSLENAHLILYRRKVAMSHQSKQLVANFSSVNVQMVGGLNRFQYSIKSPNNAYNCYVLTPNSTNLISTADGIKDYLISVDDVPLTSIYIDSSGSAVHRDNLLRVFGNSAYYQPKSIVANRDKEITGGFEPTMFVGKVFHSQMKGEPQVLPFDHPDRNIKVELVAADGSTTPTKNVYIFLEKWDEN